MRLTRKGDLALSTNAIVVLIIAVIILGLIITFVTQGFSSVSAKFMAEADKIPDPNTPGPATPVTVTENVHVATGDQFAFKISVFSEAGATTAPTITCADTTIKVPTLANKVIAARGHVTWVAILTAGTTKGKSICTSTLGSDSADTVVTVT